MKVITTKDIKTCKHEYSFFQKSNSTRNDQVFITFICHKCGNRKTHIYTMETQKTYIVCDD